MILLCACTISAAIVVLEACIQRSAPASAGELNLDVVTTRHFRVLGPTTPTATSTVVAQRRKHGGSAAKPRLA